jgi:hypothetical protein
VQSADVKREKSRKNRGFLRGGGERRRRAVSVFFGGGGEAKKKVDIFLSPLASDPKRDCVLVGQLLRPVD